MDVEVSAKAPARWSGKARLLAGWAAWPAVAVLHRAVDDPRLAG
ncbi:Hypothetical protein I596_2997 [Dokdonella koreensis DS-123]|uniref:Uncharacterized protein n=1 Tax=Dokdonella koreensis DS-123 TaxID=1300342 RepID=A0A160DWI3_9GAMM|nr:Hypothetical protein I596_2997 [Dokdonella koreensis DS-123]